MTTIIFSSIAMLLYLLTAGWLGYHVFKLQLDASELKIKIITVGGIALLLHALVLYQGIITDLGLNLGFYNALSLISWLVALLVVCVAMIRPVENLTVVFLPAAALALFLELIFPTQHILSDSNTIGLRMHILLSITAYSLLAIAALQAIILAIQERQLHNKHPVRIMQRLPPMQTMEALLIQMIAIGFFLLSLSLVTGLMFLHDIFAQHLVHKIFLSSLAWLIFALVLWGRWALGWRGKKLIRWTLGGFISLMLAYFGSKLVLELILHRI